MPVLKESGLNLNEPMNLLIDDSNSSSQSSYSAELVNKDIDNNDELSFVFEYGHEGGSSRCASNNSGPLDLMTFARSASYAISDEET